MVEQKLRRYWPVLMVATAIAESAHAPLIRGAYAMVDSRSAAGTASNAAKKIATKPGKNPFGWIGAEIFISNFSPVKKGDHLLPDQARSPLSRLSTKGDSDDLPSYAETSSEDKTRSPISLLHPDTSAETATQTVTAGAGASQDSTDDSSDPVSRLVAVATAESPLNGNDGFAAQGTGNALAVDYSAGANRSSSDSAVAVPEPGMLAAIGLGTITLLGRQRRRPRRPSFTRGR